MECDKLLPPEPGGGRHPHGHIQLHFLLHLHERQVCEVSSSEPSFIFIYQTQLEMSVVIDIWKEHYSKVSTWHITHTPWPQELALWWVLLLHEPVHLPVLSALLGVHHVGHHTGPEASHHVPTPSKVNKKTFIDMMLKLSEFPSHCIYVHKTLFIACLF